MSNAGARVIMACRSLRRAEEAKCRLLGAGGRLEVRLLDLSSLASVRSFAEGIQKDRIKVHVLINNAAVMWCPYTETADGYELQVATNYLGHFLLTNLLLPQMKHAQAIRIVNVSSVGHVATIPEVDAAYRQLMARGPAVDTAYRQLMARGPALVR
ncbi:Short-chain dehydrogenase/reductase SDR [Trinorchestia longiramus]|nr:Short-chain dehydrogenase/reductase SDR [Trinorchestia longiramus]